FPSAKHHAASFPLRADDRARVNATDARRATAARSQCGFVAAKTETVCGRFARGSRYSRAGAQNARSATRAGRLPNAPRRTPAQDRGAAATFVANRGAAFP